jgi:thiamine pyrophosphokinase
LEALVIGNGRCPDRAALDRAWPEWSSGIDLVIAADGGAAHAFALGTGLDLAIGDGDSIDAATRERLVASSIPFRAVPPEKDESDLELALTEAVRLGATRVTVVAALGGSRLEHAVANLGLLALPALSGCDVAIVDERSWVRCVRGGETAVIRGAPTDFVSLFPWGGPATGVVTDGLRYPLHHETLHVGPSRGLSNELLGERATVTVETGLLLLIHTRRD